MKLADRLTPIPELTISDYVRFLKKVKRVGNCWIWQASRFDDRYGRFTVKAESYGAHRCSYKFAHGDPGSNLVLHTCDNSLCVNPDHLYLGDSFDNAEDRRLSNHGPKGSLNGLSKLHESDIPRIRELLKVQGYISISKLYGVTSGTIREIAKGRTWSHVK